MASSYDSSMNPKEKKTICDVKHVKLVDLLRTFGFTQKHFLSVSPYENACIKT